MNQQRMQQAQQQGGGAPATTKVTPGGNAAGNISSPGGLSSSPPGAVVTEDSEAQSPPAKRVKMEPLTVTPVVQSPHVQQNTAVAPGKSDVSSVTGPKQHTLPHPQQLAKPGIQTVVKVESVVNPSQSSQGSIQPKLNGPQHRQGPSVKSEGLSLVKEEVQSAAVARTSTHGAGGAGVVPDPLKPETASAESSVPSTTVASTSKTGKPKNLGTSLTELFTPQQIREHIIGLRQWVGQVPSPISVSISSLLLLNFFLNPTTEFGCIILKRHA